MALDVGSQVDPETIMTSACPESTRPCEHSWIFRWGRERHGAADATTHMGSILAIYERNGSLGSLQSTTQVSHRPRVTQTRLPPGSSVVTFKM